MTVEKKSQEKIARITADLEKERAKVVALQQENDTLRARSPTQYGTTGDEQSALLS